MNKRFFLSLAVLLLTSMMFASSASAGIASAVRNDTGNCVPSATGLQLTDGAQAYCDRENPTYNWSGFPAELTAALPRVEYLIVSNEDRTADPYQLTLTFDNPGVLLLFIDNRVDVGAQMPWVATEGFEVAKNDADQTLEVTLITMPAFPNEQFIIYEREVNAAEVAQLGTVVEEQDQGGTGMYGVAYYTYEADIALTAENLGSEPVTAGAADEWWVKFTVTNNGPDDATGVVVNTTFTASNPLTGTTCSVLNSDRVWTDANTPWDIGDLDAGSSVVVERKCTIGAQVIHGTTVDWDMVLASVNEDQGANTGPDGPVGIDSTIQREATWNVGKVWDGGEVDVQLTCGGSVVDSTTTVSKTAVLTHTGFADGVNCVVTETVPPGEAPNYVGQCDVNPTVSGNGYSCRITNSTSEVRIWAYKYFTDGEDHEVTINVECNDGFISQDGQAVITGGDPAGHTFIITDFVDGALDCTVSESGVSDGYTQTTPATPMYTFTNIYSSQGTLPAQFVNTAKNAEYTVTKEWMVTNSGGNYIDEDVSVTIECTGPIVGDSTSPYRKSGILGDGDSLMASVYIGKIPVSCTAWENDDQSGVLTENECSGYTSLSAGQKYGCTIYNTVFFEGIPTLSQYGMAIMALLMLGIGFVGFRRFI